MSSQSSQKPQAPEHAPGRVEIDQDRGTLHFVRRIPHPPEAVWAALTEPEQLEAWFVQKAYIDGRPGGSVEMIASPMPMHWTGKVLVWEPPRIFEYEWQTPPRPEIPQGETESVVRWELAPTGDGATMLTLTHRRLTKGTALGFAPGTHAFLDRLQAHLDRDPLPDWQKRYAEVAGAYPAWGART